MAIAMEAFQFQERVENGPLAGLEKAAETQPMGLAVAQGQDRFRHQSPYCFRLRPTEDGFGHRVPVGDYTLGVHRDHPVESGIKDAAKPPVVVALRRPGGLSFGRGADLALDGRSQPRKVALEDVVVRAAAHCRDGGIFTDGPRDDDKWDIEVESFQDLERPGSAELGEAVVGNDQVEPGRQPGDKSGLRVDALPDGVETGVVKVLCDEGGIVGPVLNDQDAEWFGHGMVMTLFVCPS